MSGRFFIDTVFVQALFNSNDQYHQRATMWAPRLTSANEVDHRGCTN
jgi:hypothetical protein